ncbi:alpha/beta fold hydrolase [Microbulbifer mangrovi]|uniref:alpha/beta fold hydrolase n=1 Tax=Microbulbifer mangrovi TaxID=927787 RepID=UPI00099085C6|nr:alpha/beta hydrolase [Microbulbifer mangrovi]
MAKKIILVHGLGGTAEGTWGKFPDLLESDTDLDYTIVSYGYQSPNFVTQCLSRAPSILNIANGLLTDIQARCDLHNDEIILAGHSLGGVVIKRLLLRMKDKNIAHNIKKVCFFDVPHDGSGYANIGQHIAFRNRHLKSLCRDSSELDDLNDRWVDSDLDRMLDIISIVAANDDIVSSSSSKSIFRYHQVETINDVNHKTIVKPESRESTSYLVFKRFILEKNTVAKYKNIASRDLDNWKRMERNHSYTYASDAERSKNLESLVAAIDMQKSVVRLTGASGLGKTRLLLEAIDKSESIDDTCVLIFSASGHETLIRESLRKMAEDRVHGLVVVEDCSVSLHNQLAREIIASECHIKLVTVFYFDEQVDDSIHIQISPLSDEVVAQILTPILVGMDRADVARVARFAQGYPLMATLIAEQYQNEGRLLGSIEKDSVVRSLIEGNGGISNDEEDILSACSLFDVFGVEEDAARNEAKFIAEDVAGKDLRAFDRVIRKFTKRQVINRAGRYARLVPKPLALTLASEWWQGTPYDRQKQLVDSVPDSLLPSFCTQASYLDHQPNVQKFSDKLFGGASPFVQAEELLTERGSKLFRAFVEVNPESTSNALYHILTECSREQLQNISGDIRRNLVWGLEKLCFRSDVFEKSAWCMLLLASAENESWSNNATGMFAQLFRVNLSGTQAKPNVRFDLLRKGISENHLSMDMVVLDALEQALNTYGGTRTIGAEFQGTKAPLEEWRPKSWPEVYDFWQQACGLMLSMFGRGDSQKKKILSVIGGSIRGFVARGQIKMLDSAIRFIISENGRYWPQALESIKNTLRHDSGGMDKGVEDSLRQWLELLSPNHAELSDRLKILVTNPPWEHHKNEEGHYIDVAAQNAKDLATEISRNVEELIPYLNLLLIGDQKQAYAFGCQLAKDVNDPSQLLGLVLCRIVEIEKPDQRFVLGLFRGIFERSPTDWQENVEKVVSNEELVFLYPSVVCTGDLEKAHLDVLLDLIRHGTLAPNSANVLSYGAVTDSIDPDIIANFCLQLAEMGAVASWSALNVIYMYCFAKKDSICGLRDQVKRLVTAVPLHEGLETASSDVHHWFDLADKILKDRDAEFAVDLTNQLIDAAGIGLDHGHIWSYIKPLMLKLMEEYGDILWPIIGEAISHSEGLKLYWLQQLLDREAGRDEIAPSVLSALPVESVIEWCFSVPEIGPVFVARCLNVFELNGEDKLPSPLFVSVLENFGDENNVVNELRANVGTRSWSGSLVPYLESDKTALKPLLEHDNSNVRTWVRDYLTYIERQIEYESSRDDEQGLGIY